MINVKRQLVNLVKLTTVMILYITKKKFISKKNIIKLIYPLKINVINLDRRPDRWDNLNHSLQQFSLINLSRFSAIEFKHGDVGCALSHLMLLLENLNSNYIIICEDDFRIKINEQVFFNILKEFIDNTALDVLCMGCKSDYVNIPISKNLLLSANIQTTSLYVAKQKAIKPLIAAFTLSLNLYSEGQPMSKRAIDQVWKKIQWRSGLNFCIPKLIVGFQEPGYSDIEKKYVSYGSEFRDD